MFLPSHVFGCWLVGCVCLVGGSYGEDWIFVGESKLLHIIYIYDMNRYCIYICSIYLHERTHSIKGWCTDLTGRGTAHAPLYTVVADISTGA